MAHIVYVDLSAKVEHWTKTSVVALSNDTSKALLLPAKVKQQMRRRLAAAHGTKSVHYRVLAILIYLAVRDDLANIRQIVIDQDYSGQRAEATIKNLLLQMLRKELPEVKAGYIRFAAVAGKRADRLAKEVYDGKVKPDRRLLLGEIEDLLDKK